MSLRLTLADRIKLAARLGAYMEGADEAWQDAKYRAAQANAWFTNEHVEAAVANVAAGYLKENLLNDWVARYKQPNGVKTVGIVMAGNIPLVGFHDFLCGFISGHDVRMKLSSKDEVLMKHILDKLTAWEPLVAEQVAVAERLKGCDAYIATGSNNTARYFEHYFGKYPNIIRRNRTSVAILDGTETDEELALLADDVYLYFGLGCRNVTQLCVPRGYNFERLLNIFKRNNSYADLSKYQHNYDYHLAIYLLNRVAYMSNESLLMVENNVPFSAVSVLHYRYYEELDALTSELTKSEDIQTIVGHGFTPFGQSQQPALADYADGVDTMAFLCGLLG